MKKPNGFSFFRLAGISLALIFIGCGGSQTTRAGSQDYLTPAQSSQVQSGITQTLIDLLNKQDSTKISPEDYVSTSLKQIITLGTPAGYRIKLRYLTFGVALVEALKVQRDPDLSKRLIEVVQWSRTPSVKAEAILTLASLYDPSHKKYFKEAILDSKIGIRFAGVEALQIWGQPEAIPLLKMAMDRDWSPFMQVFAAQALISLGDESGLPILWKSMDHNSWVVRAMAARFLGDYASPDDYPKMVEYLTKESKNDYVIAELSIAALKLISKKAEKATYSPADKKWRENDDVKFTVGRDKTVEIEPLIIVPPRLRIPASLQVASQINSKLLRIIKEKLSTPMDPIEAQDPVVADMNSLLTPAGFGLIMRYSELSYLIIEGLAGTNDMLIRTELEKMATDSPNPLIRAVALVSLAYDRKESDLYMIQAALRDKTALVRFAGMEAVEVGRFESALGSVNALAYNDPSPALQVYAIQVLSKFGDISGRNLLIAKLSEQDWPARAMAFWFLGRYGSQDDYSIILSRLSNEQNPFVQAEIVLALIRLSPL